MAASNAAAKPSFGQRLLQTGRAVARGFVPGAAIVSAGQGLNTDTEDYAKRFGLENTQPGVLRDVGVRSLGVASDFANNLLLGLPGMLMRKPSAVATTASTDAAPAPVATPAPFGVNRVMGADASAASAELDGTGVPGVGTGVIRNNTTGAVYRANTGVPAAAAPTTAAAPAKRATAPQIGTEGGIFQNLVPFVNEVNRAKVAAANSGQDFKRAAKLVPLQQKDAELKISASNADSARITALARVAAAMKDTGKVVQDAAGNPIEVKDGKATILKPQAAVTEADITETMKANKMTRAQVIARLEAEGRMTGGGFAGGTYDATTGAKIQ